MLKGPIWAGLALFGVMLILMIPLNANFLPTWIAAPFGLLLCYLITAAFGHELGDRLLATWVIQPKSRRELWRLKLKSVGTVYGTIWLLVGITAILTPIHLDHTPSETLSWSSMVPTFQFWALWLPWMCFGPGIYFTLKLRNPTASFWLTGAIPIMFIPVVMFVFNLISTIIGTTFPTHVALSLFVVLSFAYGAWGIWAARKQFLHWEDLGLKGKAIEFRLRKTSSTRTQADGIPPKRRSWWAAITMRELQLQQINILAGFVLFAITWAAYYWHQSMVNKGKFGDEVEMIGLLPTVFRFLLFILPSSIAAMSVADIRRQDAHTWELMLPVSKRFQFTVKMLTCLFLGWLFAAGLPFTFDKNVSFVSTFGPYYHHIALGVITMAAFVMSAVSFYISSLTSSFLKSFSFSLALMPLMIFYLGFLYALANGNENQFILGLFVVPTGVVLVLSILTLWWSRSNFAAPVILRNHKIQNWKRWGWSSVVIVIWLGIMIDRSWERVTMIEPKAKASEVLTIDTQYMDEWSKSNLLQQPGKSALNSSTYSTYPDMGDQGREPAIALSRNGLMNFLNPICLTTHYVPNSFKNKQTLIPVILNRNLPPTPELASHVSVAETDCNFRHRFIIDLKGRLWMWEQQEEQNFLNSKSPFDRPIAPSELIKGKRFRNLRVTPSEVYVIDEDDFLWRSEYLKQGNSYTGEMTSLEKIFPKHQWKEISIDNGVFGLKKDGTLWAWHSHWMNIGKDQEDKIDVSIPNEVFTHRKWRSIFPHNKFFIAEAEDGSIWVPTHMFSNQISDNKIKNYANRFLCNVKLPGLKQYSLNEYWWKLNSGFYWIKNDGSLWKSEFELENHLTHTDRDIVANPVKTKQISRRNDWVFLTYSAGMTADGKIWNWDRRQLNPWNPFPARFRHKVVADLGR